MISWVTVEEPPGAAPSAASAAAATGLDFAARVMTERGRAAREATAPRARRESAGAEPPAIAASFFGPPPPRGTAFARAATAREARRARKPPEAIADGCAIDTSAIAPVIRLPRRSPAAGQARDRVFSSG